MVRVEALGKMVGFRVEFGTSGGGVWILADVRHAVMQPIPAAAEKMHVRMYADRADYGDAF